MKREVARHLIELGAVKFSPEKPYLYASGLRGPIYCDNRLLLSHVEVRERVIAAFMEIIEKNQLEFDLLGGIATAGIPYASFVADRLKKRMVYVRPKPKGHGRQNQVEGDAKPHERVLLFEDLVNQGASLEDAMRGLEASELKCDACLCVVDYQMAQAKKRLKDLSLTLFPLTDFSSLTTAAFELNLIGRAELNLLEEWQRDPEQWSRRF